MSEAPSAAANTWLAVPGIWHIRPEKVGDVGVDVGGERWIWLPQGLKWLDQQEWVGLEFPTELETVGIPDMMAALRDVARGS